MNDLLEKANAIFPTVGKMELPEAAWTSDQLGKFAKRCDSKCSGLGKKMAIHRYREGHALELAKEKVPPRRWGRFLRKHGISRSSDARARKLYSEVESEEETPRFERHGRLRSQRHRETAGIRKRRCRVSSRSAKTKRVSSSGVNSGSPIGTNPLIRGWRCVTSSPPPGKVWKSLALNCTRPRMRKFLA